MTNFKINGKSHGHKIIDINMESYFELEQVFCSCTGKFHGVYCVNDGKPIETPTPEEYMTLTIEDEEGKIFICKMEIKNKVWKELSLEDKKECKCESLLFGHIPGCPYVNKRAD